MAHPDRKRGELFAALRTNNKDEKSKQRQHKSVNSRADHVNTEQHDF